MLASDQIRNSVKEILIDCGITGPPVDLRIIAEHFGLHYVETSRLPNCAEAFILPSGSRVDAVVNKDLPKIHSRFSLAHQLYHYRFEDYLHVLELRARPPDPQDVTNISGKRSESEVLADTFATELLRPVGFLQKHYRSGLVVADVLRVFHVSKLVALSSQYIRIQIGREKFSG